MANPTSTILGVNGTTTVVLNWTTESNAAADQQTLNLIQGVVTAGSAEKVSYTGNSTLPALSNSTIEGPLFRRQRH